MRLPSFLQASYFTLSGGFPHFVFPLIYDYKAHAQSYGAEAFATWNATDRWKISPTLTMLNLSALRDRIQPGFDHRP